MRRCQHAECGRSLNGYRADARYCGPPCRAAACRADVAVRSRSEWTPEAAEDFIEAALRTFPGLLRTAVGEPRRPDVSPAPRRASSPVLQEVDPG
jgi:hypothetical protein